MFRWRWYLAVLPLLLLPVLCAPHAFGQTAQKPALSPEQTQAVQQIIHDYLLDHPELAVEMLQESKRRMQEAAETKARQTVLARRSELLSDPASPVGGNPIGDVTMVEFFDYRCPYCKQMEPALEQLLHEDHKLRFVYKEFPILGPASVYAARVALAAQKQGRYAAIHDALMAHSGPLDEKAVLAVAQGAGLDVERAKADMTSPEVEAELRRNLALGQALALQGTPGFVIGTQIVPGVTDVDTIRRLLASARGLE